MTSQVTFVTLTTVAIVAIIAKVAIAVCDRGDKVAIVTAELAIIYRVQRWR
jgi:hypothetical protein